MRPLFSFVAVGIISATLMVGIMFAYSNFFGSKAVKENYFNHLQIISNSKADRIGAFLSERKRDAVFLSETKNVEESFDKQLVENVEQVTTMVKNVAQRTGREADAYIQNHPNLTVNDLASDPEFRAVALKRVGEIGYTVFHGPDTIINYIHWDPEEEGDDHGDVFRENPEGQQAKLLLTAKNSTSDVSGFYTKKTSDGVLKEKFMYMSMIPTRTADGVRTAIQATVFLDEFGKTLSLAKSLDEDLKRFKEANGYSDLSLIDPNGNIVWSAEKENDLGTNLNKGVYRETGLAKAFNQTKESLETVVSDPGYYEASEKNVFFISTPVFGTDQSGQKILKGVLAFQLDAKKIEDIMAGGVNTENDEEVYVVSSSGAHITPLRYGGSEEDLGVRRLIQSSEISRCFHDMSLGGSGEKLTPNNFSKYNNYFDRPVYGSHQYIPGTRWCVISEIGADKIKGGVALFSDRTTAIYVLLVSILVSVLIILGLNGLFFVDKK